MTHKIIKESFSSKTKRKDCITNSFPELEFRSSNEFVS